MPMNVYKKTVFLRIDANVPLDRGSILSDYKLQAVLPTIVSLLHQQAYLIIGTHLGRPTRQTQKYLSTKQLVPWFAEHPVDLHYISDITQAAHHNFSADPRPVILENLRFYPGEQEKSLHFAKQLKQLSEIYINDAFGVIHRDDTSISLAPSLYEPESKNIGPLITKELTCLEKIKHSPQSPFVLVIGGNKLATKTVLLSRMISQKKSSRPQKILIGGALAHPFLQSQGIFIGSSLKHPGSITMAKDIIALAEHNGVELLTPIDVLVTKNIHQGHTRALDIAHIQDDDIIIDIGPKTIDLFSSEIAQAQTIFANGTMGVYTIKEFAHGTRSIVRAIAQSDGYSVIGGGDATAAALSCPESDRVDLLSSGGGATLAYLAVEDTQELPGLSCLHKA